MSNNQAAEAIRNMTAEQQGQLKKGLLGLICKCLSLLALIGVIGAFFTMQEEESQHSIYVNEGMVSRALVLGTEVDDYTLANAQGDTAPASMNFVRIAHDPESEVRYADLGANVQEADLPVPPQGSGYTASIDMDDAEFAGVKAGDVLTVVATPYEPRSPKTLATVQDYSPDTYYLWMGIFAVLAIAMWFVGRAVSRR